MYFVMRPVKCEITGRLVATRYGRPTTSEKTAQKAVKRLPGAYATDEHGKMVLQNIRPDLPTRL